MKQFGPDVSRQVSANLKLTPKAARQVIPAVIPYMKIFEANRDVLSNPDLIKIGQKLRIPK